jgi:hypothetical protein
MAARAPSPQAVVSAPAAVAVGYRSWLVPMQNGFVRFMYTDGHGDLTRYNFAVLATRTDKTLVQDVPHRNGFTDIVSDSFKLTKAGEAALKDTRATRDTKAAKQPGRGTKRATGSRASDRVVQLRFACTGHSDPKSKSTAHPNCWTVCNQPAGGVPGCCSARHQWYHRCGCRLIVTATLAQVAASTFSARIVGSHVPNGVMQVPPGALTTARRANLDVVESIKTGSLATNAINEQAAALARSAGSDMPESAADLRWLADVSQVNGIVKRQRIQMRGGPGPDHERFDKLVRERLIPGGFVLLYQPDAEGAEDGILVMSPLWSLLMAHKHGRRNVATDAKVDTVHGAQWKWSSVRVPVSGNVSVLLIAWIARFENTYTVETALRALKACVQCTDDQCKHPFTETHEPMTDGRMRYRKVRACAAANGFRPNVTCDKHRPTINGMRAAGYGCTILCRFHIPRCLDDKMVKLKDNHDNVLPRIAGPAAAALHWGFRLVQRSTSVAQARIMRNAFVHWMYAESIAAVQPLFSPEQVTAWATYLDRCWMHPLAILEAWIDGDHTVDSGFVSTSGVCESSHHFWTQHINRQVTQKLPSSVVSSTVGVACDGQPVLAMFPANQRRFTSQKEPRPNAMAVLATRRAQLEFLVSGSAAVLPTAGTPVRLKSFKTASLIVAGATGTVTHGSLRPLQSHMVQQLGCGGQPGTTVPEGEYSLDERCRCSCPVGLWLGPLSAAGPCKHGRFALLCAEAASGSVKDVRARCAQAVGSWIWHREKSKGSARHADLWAAAKSAKDGMDTAGEGIVAALRAHPSTPPTGGADTVAPAVSAAVLSEELQCVMPPHKGAGFVLAPSPTITGGHVIVAFGETVTKPQSGTAMRAGDTVLPGPAITQAGELRPSVLPVTIRFLRPGRAAHTVPSGGRAAKVPPKFGSGLPLAGAPKLVSPKPSKSRPATLAQAAISPAGPAAASATAAALAVSGGLNVATDALRARLAATIAANAVSEAAGEEHSVPLAHIDKLWNLTAPLPVGVVRQLEDELLTGDNYMQ